MAVIEQNPLEPFFYALKSSEAKRQYPKRFKMFLDFMSFQGELEEQARIFLAAARNNPPWVQDNFMRFISYHTQKVRRGEKAAGSVINYYRAFKLFCEMNDLQLNWRKISKGLPKARKSSNDRAPTVSEIKKLIDRNYQIPS